MRYLIVLTIILLAVAGCNRDDPSPAPSASPKGGSVALPPQQGGHEVAEMMKKSSGRQ